MDEIARLLRDQAGVISRRQVLALGGRPAEIERALRRREWVRIMPGVFLDHTGPPTWLQRAWAGALHHEPAALAGLSALRAVAGPAWRRCPDHLPIEIAIDLGRTVNPAQGYHVRRCAGLAERVQWNAGPPRIRVEHAAIDVAARAGSDYDAVALLADVCQSRRTTALRVLDALAERQRVPRRAWLEDVLCDIAEGSCSVLEQGYLHHVERAHHLPRADRQVGGEPGMPSIYRDVRYSRWGVAVELDGRMFHDSAAARDADLDRDLVAALERLMTIRLGWGQVFDRPCLTARRIGALLAQRGWPDRPIRCRPACVAA